jgi:hypothetical protein
MPTPTQKLCNRLLHNCRRAIACVFLNSWLQATRRRIRAAIYIPVEQSTDTAPLFPKAATNLEANSTSKRGSQRQLPSPSSLARACTIIDPYRGIQKQNGPHILFHALTERAGKEHSCSTLYAWAASLVSGVSPDRTELIGFIAANPTYFSASLRAGERRKNPSDSRRFKVKSIL